MKKGVPVKYIDIIRNMYDGVVANVRTCGGIISDFFYHNWIASRICIEFLFAIVMNELTRTIQDEIP